MVIDVSFQQINKKETTLLQISCIRGFIIIQTLSLPGTEAPFYHKSSHSQSYNSMCCLGSTSVVHLRSLWEEEIPEELCEEMIDSEPVSVDEGKGMFDAMRAMIE